MPAKNHDAMEEDNDPMADEQKEMAKKETRDKQATAHAQLPKEKERWKRVDAMQAALVNAKIQYAKQLEERWVAKEEMEARAANINEEAAKCKKVHSSQHYFPESPLRAENKVDLMMTSPTKKKQKMQRHLIQLFLKLIWRQMIILQRIQPWAKNLLVQVHKTKTSLVSPPDPVSILRNSKKSMLEAAFEGVTPGTNSFYDLEPPGSSKEGIPPEEFANKVLLKLPSRFHPSLKILLAWIQNGPLPRS
jgi:hypothetical protein